MTGERAAEGRPVGDVDSAWESAAAELTPDKSLARVDARAQQIVGTVSLVGVVLTGFGLAGSTLGHLGDARWFAAAATAAAVCAVLLALGASLLRVRPALAPGNLLEVEAWYRAQFRRAYPIVAAGWLLLVGMALAGVAVGIVLIQGRSSDPMISVANAGAGGGSKLTVRVEFAALDPGELVRTEVTGLRAGAAPRSLARAVTRAGAGGASTTTLELDDVVGYTEAQVTARLAGRRCAVTLPIGGASTGAAPSTCGEP
jgi:hypothetical protein